MSAPPTWKAVVGDLQVRLELRWALRKVIQLGIRYPYPAFPTTGAALLQHWRHIHVTTDVAIISGDALSDAHASVGSAAHDDDLARGTGGVQFLRLTDLQGTHWNNKNREFRKSLPTNDHSGSVGLGNAWLCAALLQYGPHLINNTTDGQHLLVLV